MFERFVRDKLAPRLDPDDVVVWYKQSIHRPTEVRRLIEAWGATLAPQPRYSPEWPGRRPAHAWEEMWSKVKHEVRRARADTQSALEVALGASVNGLEWDGSAG